MLPWPPFLNWVPRLLLHPASIVMLLLWTGLAVAVNYLPNLVAANLLPANGEDLHIWVGIGIGLATLLIYLGMCWWVPRQLVGAAQGQGRLGR